MIGSIGRHQEVELDRDVRQGEEEMGSSSRSPRLSQWQADLLWVMHSGNSHEGHTKWHLPALNLDLLSFLSLFRAIICLIPLPSAACIISHTASSPTNATSDNERAKRAISVTFLRCNVSPAASYPTYRQNLLASVTPGKSMKMDFTVDVYNFLLFFLLPEEEQYVRDLLWR